MATTPVAAGETLCRLIKEYRNNPYCLELIQFFGWHPQTSFSGLAVRHALTVNGESRYIERALCHLVDKGVVRTYSENNVSLYCLTEDPCWRQVALDIARLEWSQWQSMLRGGHAHLWGYLARKPRVRVDVSHG